MDMELTRENVETVLNTHGVVLEPAKQEQAIDDVLLEAEHIEHLMFEHTGSNARLAALLSAIEDVLIEQGVIEPEKLFNPEDTDLEEEDDVMTQEDAEEDEDEDYLS